MNDQPQTFQPLSNNIHEQSTQVTKWWRNKRAAFVGVAALLIFSSVLGFILSRPGIVRAQTWVVAPNGSTSASGTDSNNALTLQAALDKAKPGDVIQLQPGTYKIASTLTTKTNGEPNRPITIKGTETGQVIGQRNKTVLVGKGHIFDIENSYYVLDGFTINGQPNLNFNDIPTDPQQIVKYKDANQSKITDGRLIYIGNKARDVKGTVINNMFLTGAGGECVRMRNFTSDSKVTNSFIYRCGFIKKAKDYSYHNGEGVYIGTSPKSTDQPFYKNDNSSNNLIQNNIIETFGSECVDVKENASNNIIDRNQCHYGLGTAADGSESILEVRGKNNQVTNNSIQYSLGYGIKLWSEANSDGGGNNIVAGNQLSNIADATYTLKDQSQPQEICENTYNGVALIRGFTGVHADVTKKCSKQYPIGVTATSGNTTTPTPTAPAQEKPVPQIVTVNPVSGLTKGGYAITIKIKDFTSGTPVVTMGGTKASNIKRIDGETVTATVPARSTAGSVPLIVQIGEQVGSAVFTYTAEPATSNTPTPVPTTPVPPTTTPSSSAALSSTITERFTSMANVTVVRGGTWKINSDEDLQLADPKSDLSVGNANIVAMNTAVAGNYTLNVRAKVKGTTNNFNDFSIIFDYADQNNYSFVSFNESNDENTSGIFQVVNGNVAQVADITTSINADTYYSVTLVHGNDGTVTVKLNNTQVAQVKVAQQPGSQIGLGTRNDSAMFDDLTVKR